MPLDVFTEIQPSFFMHWVVHTDVARVCVCRSCVFFLKCVCVYILHTVRSLNYLMLLRRVCLHFQPLRRWAPDLCWRLEQSSSRACFRRLMSCTSQHQMLPHMPLAPNRDRPVLHTTCAVLLYTCRCGVKIFVCTVGKKYGCSWEQIKPSRASVRNVLEVQIDPLAPFSCTSGSIITEF